MSKYYNAEARKRYRQTESGRKQRAKEKASYYGRSAGKYPKRRWTDEELKKVFNSPKTDNQLSDELERSVAAIQKARWLYADKYA